MTTEHNYMNKIALHLTMKMEAERITQGETFINSFEDAKKLLQCLQDHSLNKAECLNSYDALLDKCQKLHPNTRDLLLSYKEILCSGPHPQIDLLGDLPDHHTEDDNEL